MIEYPQIIRKQRGATMLTLKNLSLTAADAQGRADIVKTSLWT